MKGKQNIVENETAIFQCSIAGNLGLYYVVGFILKSVFLHMSKMSCRERGCVDGQERNLVCRFL